MQDSIMLWSAGKMIPKRTDVSYAVVDIWFNIDSTKPFISWMVRFVKALDKGAVKLLHDTMTPLCLRRYCKQLWRKYPNPVREKKWKYPDRKSLILSIKLLDMKCTQPSKVKVQHHVLLFRYEDAFHRWYINLYRLSYKGWWSSYGCLDVFLFKLAGSQLKSISFWWINRMSCLQKPLLKVTCAYSY